MSLGLKGLKCSFQASGSRSAGGVTTVYIDQWGELQSYICV